MRFKKILFFLIFLILLLNSNYIVLADTPSIEAGAAILIETSTRKNPF